MDSNWSKSLIEIRASMYGFQIQQIFICYIYDNYLADWPRIMIQN